MKLIIPTPTEIDDEASLIRALRALPDTEPRRFQAGDIVRQRAADPALAFGLGVVAIVYAADEMTVEGFDAETGEHIRRSFSGERMDLIEPAAPHPDRRPIPPPWEGWREWTGGISPDLPDNADPEGSVVEVEFRNGARLIEAVGNLDWGLDFDPDPTDIRFFRPLATLHKPPVHDPLLRDLPDPEWDPD